MNYTLAKQLKDAGFPQVGDNRGSDGELAGLGDGISIEGNVYNPTLSELIEACGDSFGRLNQIHKFKYVAYASESYPKPLYEDTTGSTPEEAVARLYLALNKTE